MKIVVLDGYTENPGDLSWEGLEALGTLTVYDRTPGDKVIERIADAQAVYTNKTPITGETIEKCANMKFIGVLATGYNVIDIKAARSANVVVSNIPSYGTDAVAQYSPTWPRAAGSMRWRFCWSFAIISESIRIA